MLPLRFHVVPQRYPGTKRPDLVVKAKIDLSQERTFVQDPFQGRKTAACANRLFSDEPRRTIIPSVVDALRRQWSGIRFGSGNKSCPPRRTDPLTGIGLCGVAADEAGQVARRSCHGTTVSFPAIARNLHHRRHR